MKDKLIKIFIWLVIAAISVLWFTSMVMVILNVFVKI